MRCKINQYSATKKPIVVVDGMKKIGDCLFVEAVPQVHYASVIFNYLNYKLKFFFFILVK